MLRKSQLGCIAHKSKLDHVNVSWNIQILPANLWACDLGDVSTPSFGSHLQPIPTRGADYAHHICYTDANILCGFDIAFVPKLDKDQAIMFTQARFI